jgi:hypothetical protein
MTWNKVNKYCTWIGKYTTDYEPGDYFRIEANIEIPDGEEKHLKEYFRNYGDFEFLEDETKNNLDDAFGDIAELNHEYYNEIKLGNI